MSGENEEEKPFAAERAKTGRAKCKKCKCPIEKDTLRVAKLVSNPFSDGKVKAWHHLTCLSEVFAKQRATTKKIEDPEEDITGWAELSDEDKDSIIQMAKKFQTSFGTASKDTGKRKLYAYNEEKSSEEKSSDKSKKKKTDDVAKKVETSSRDDAFFEFQRICTEIANNDAYTVKTAILKKMLVKGSNGDGFKSDVKLWCKLLLPGAVKRIYNLQSKQVVKLFARLLLQDEDDMLRHLEMGDVAETIRVFYRKSSVFTPASKSSLTVQQVDEFLEKLSYLTKQDEQIQHFRSILPGCTADDLKMIIRLIKHDLRINAGPKHILAAVHDDAYEAFQTSRNLNTVIDRCLGCSSSTPSPEKSSQISGSSNSPGGNMVTVSLMTPVLPMLAEACKSVEMAMEKCPNGMLSEVKYDGERVQVHKRGSEFRYFSRSLKPVLTHKVNLFKDYIPVAFPDGDDLILDAEVLMIDTKTGQPLPFGSLGIHKRNEFKNANACLFIFDCIYYNGDTLLHRTMQERRKILKDRMTEIPNRIMLSEVQEVHDPQDLTEMIGRVLKMGLEGLVLKDMNSKYEPGKRHWLKVKKDYLFGGAMADTADLVVLGAWYGTGSKGGMMSVFLMGCYDEVTNQWVTVTKVHTGHDDATLAKLQNELDMIKIGKDPSKLPHWIRANKRMIPDFIAADPKKQPVWEITGTEFTNQGVHTADGISIRFPRVTRIRDDKDWSTATSLKELRNLFEKSSQSINLDLLLGNNGETATRKKKRGGKQATLDSVQQIKIIKKQVSSATNEEDKISRQASARSPKEDACSVRNGEKNISKEKVIKINDNEAAYYSIVDNHYIEYTVDGTPLNWIDDRKPSKGLPANAKPLSSFATDRMKSKLILNEARVFTYGFDPVDLEKTLRTLKTLGATVLTKRDRQRATHVLHSSNKAPSTTLKKFNGVPKTVRHVSLRWLDEIIASEIIPNPIKHAVELTADYCTCTHTVKQR